MIQSDHLLGYTDRPNVEAGQTISLAVHAALGDYELQLVRLRHGDRSPDGPGFREQEVDAVCNGVRVGRAQLTQFGSFALIEDREAFASLGSFSISMYVWPSLIDLARQQTLFARRCAQGASGGAFGIDGEGRLCAWSGRDLVLVGPNLRLRRWTRICCAFDALSGILTLMAKPVAPLASDEPLSIAQGSATFNPAPLGSPVTLAASHDGWRSFDHFDGKIEDVTVHDGVLAIEAFTSRKPPALPVVALWDFGEEVASDRLIDRGPHAAHGRLMQSPLRATPGHNWTGLETDFRADPSEFRAAHFHSDDLIDCGWQPDLEFAVPSDLPSGVYAFRLRSEDYEDRVPFFVTPGPDQVRAPVALVIPSFSYIAYANERISDGVDFVAAGMTDRTPQFGPGDAILAKHREFGLSMYDHHLDGSGVAYSTWRRPILNLRPDYRWWLSGAPQYLGCDLYITDWLETIGQDYDVITDHDIDEQGLDLLAQYPVVLTSSHPEYMSYAMMRAFEAYTQHEGRLMYLGGNGFYWVTSLLPEKAYAIEVRRGMAGTRAWESAPGEEHHSSTGERGGLWRHRGWPPNRIVGIGFAAQGWSRHAAAYRRLADDGQQDARWIFNGIADEVIGDFGLVMGSAAADELDRADVLRGTPEDAIVLASSGQHGPFYLQVHEDALFSHRGLGGDLNPAVRADLTFFRTNGGGAVFSVGSKSWVGSLSHNGYRNNVARITRNVLSRFLDEAMTSKGTA